jgi:transcriptional regulator of arginine metabolism
MHILRMPHTLDHAILSLLEQYELADQDHLQGMLTSQGFRVTQSTLSRHLKKLHVKKVEGIYRKVEPTRAALPAFTVTPAPPNLLVLRTEPGFANALAVRLDGAPIPGLAGTIAGDDTIFIAVKGAKALTGTAEAIDAFLKG